LTEAHLVVKGLNEMNLDRLHDMEKIFDNE
jgi:hypothetical protein